ncbi:MAG: DNA mismatch repair protein MutS [Clostridiales bacterium]|nr:DNA mismatch repair protein MutS [Clostridiales bacterium]
MRKRLANAKTRNETGFDYVLASINVNTPFGRKAIKEKSPYFPGEENLLRQEFEKLGTILRFISENPDDAGELLRIFMETKDISFTISRSGKDTLSVVELFEIKSLLLKMGRISKILSDSPVKIPESYLLEDLDALLSTLDPRSDRMDTFYVYDEFSEALSEARKRKRDFEGSIRRQQKKQKEAIMEKYGVALTPRFDCLVSKTSAEQIKMMNGIPELVKSEEDYVSVTFALRGDAETDKLLAQLDDAIQVIEQQELLVRERLSLEIAGYETGLLENCAKIGELDVAVAKALYAQKHGCTIPEIREEHVIEIEDGRHLQVEDVLASKAKAYCPVSLSLTDGVTCITGANMGGKTVSLKLAGLVPLLAQYGFFVPCKRASLGLSNYMQILIGDNQSLDRGLSGFGSEMETLKEMLDNGETRALFLIDEIASGTNPQEGFALTKGLIAYLKGKPYISLFTTHFDVGAEGGVVNLLVAGLAGVDFGKLDKELRYASRRERINIISKHMDYRLHIAAGGKEVPRDALNIARMLGINDEIIEHARKICNNDKGGNG